MFFTYFRKFGINFKSSEFDWFVDFVIFARPTDGQSTIIFGHIILYWIILYWTSVLTLTLAFDRCGLLLGRIDQMLKNVPTSWAFVKKNCCALWATSGVLYICAWILSSKPSVRFFAWSSRRRYMGLWRSQTNYLSKVPGRTAVLHILFCAATFDYLIFRDVKKPRVLLKTVRPLFCGVKPSKVYGFGRSQNNYSSKVHGRTAARTDRRTEWAPRRRHQHPNKSTYS